MLNIFSEFNIFLLIFRNDRENYNRGSAGGGRDGRDRGGYNSKDNKNTRGGSDYRSGDSRDNNKEKPKQRDRDNRPERPMPKYQPPQGGPVSIKFLNSSKLALAFAIKFLNRSSGKPTRE